MNLQHDRIDGSLLKQGREARGWGQVDIATRACLSVKQIRQLEEGGLSAFYSEAVKVTAAKKVTALLGLSEHDVFRIPSPEADGEGDMGHEGWQPQESASPTEQETLVPSSIHEEESSRQAVRWPWLVALFVGAIALAAFLRPQSEPVATEPPPPLQPALQSDSATPAPQDGAPPAGA